VISLRLISCISRGGGTMCRAYVCQRRGDGLLGLLGGLYRTDP